MTNLIRLIDAMYCYLYYIIFPYLIFTGSIVILSFSLISSLLLSHILIASVPPIFNYRAHQKKNCLSSPFPTPTNCPHSSIDQDSPSKKVNKVDLELVIASKDDCV